MRSKTKRNTLSHLRSKTKRNKRNNIYYGGNNPLPDVNELRLEIIFNDIAHNIYDKDLKYDLGEEEYLKQQEYNKDIISKLEIFVNNNKLYKSIPLSINKEINNEILTKQLESQNNSIKLCQGKISLHKIIDTFCSDYSPIYSIRLMHKNNYIGILLFKLTHRPSNHKIGNKINTSHTYMYVEYLCGSSFKKVGSMLIDVIKDLSKQLNIKSIYLISYDSSIPFYEKMNFKYKGLSWARTPIMEWNTSNI